MNQYNTHSMADWVLVPTSTPNKIFECINHCIQPVPFEEKTTVILFKTLPFYPRTQLIKLIENRTVPAITKYALYGTLDGSVQMIDWTNEPIYAVNKKAPIQISKDVFGDYIRFFFSFVVGRRGCFFIIQTDEDVKSLELSQKQQSYVQHNLPLYKVTTNVDHDFMLRSIVFFKNNLFEVDIVASCEGQVLMHNEKLVEAETNNLTDDWNLASKNK